MVVFGSYQLDTNSGDLRKFGYRIKLQPLPKRILLSLVDEPGKAVGRDILYNRLWPNGLSIDVEHGLNTAVKKLRAVLNDDAEQPRYIETVAGIGYRFIAPVKIEGGIESPGGSSREQHS
jgi:DNA-binding winged helix-turn-helix (wHTH) protein